MACTTTIYGAGLNCANGQSLGNFSSLVYQGYVTMDSMLTCGWPSLRPRIDGVLQGENYGYHPSGVTLTYSSDCTQTQRHDCVNGNCVNKSQYNTPGFFSSLAACQEVCTSNGCQPPGENYCPPGKVCIQDTEWAQIEQLSNQVKVKDCG